MYRINPIGPRPVPEPVVKVEREHRVDEHDDGDQRERKRKRAKQPPSDPPASDPGHIDIRA